MKILRTVSLGAIFMTAALCLTACKNEPQVESAEKADQTTTQTGKIKYSLDVDGRNWKVINDNKQDQLAITQYILENEEPEAATELFTITEMTDVTTTPADYFSQFITELQKRYANAKVESKIINQKTDSLLGEWWIEGKSPDNTQHEWIRIIKKGNDIAILRYSTNNVERLDQSRKAWESILNNANY